MAIIHVPAELHQKVKVAATLAGQSMQEWVADVINHYLEPPADKSKAKAKQ